VKIAMIGQKGVPATHGGVERHVEELGARLVGLGHEVTVFTRPNYTEPGLLEHRGMRLVSIQTIGSKHLDAITHSILCSFACWRGGYDVVHYHAAGPCLASPIARLRGRRVVATIHGQDWRRGKWGRAASAVLRLGEWMALHVPQATISVSESLAADYRERMGRDVAYIPNGVSIDPGDDTSILGELGIAPGGYMLFAGRLVPEKGLHHLLAARASLPSAPPLVVAGDASNSGNYVDAVRKAAGPGVVFAGYRYGAQLAALFRHAGLFVLPSDLEGLPIVLLEALAYGTPVLASDIPPNVEVLGSNGDYFKAGDVDGLRNALRGCLAEPERMKAGGDALREKAVREYDWDRVAAETSELYERLAESHAR
jgi:glycosyltransferase involved in cell wall biosynthesis